MFLEDIAPTKVFKSQHFLYKFTIHRHYVLTVEKSLFCFAGVRGKNEASPAAARCFVPTIVFLVIPPPGASSK